MSASRFANTEELKTISLIIKDLNSKEIELARDSKLNKSGANSIDSRKYTVVSELLNSINVLIEQFNMEPVPEDKIQQLQQIVIFATELQKITQRTLDEHTEILSEPRNNKRKHANMVTKGLSLSVAGLFAVTTTFSYGVGALCVGYVGSDVLQKITGMQDTDPASLRWITGLNTVAKNISLNVGKRIASLTAQAPNPALSPR